MAKFNKPTKEALEDINNAWLKSGNYDERFLINPLDILRVESSDEFEKRLAYLLMQPEYFCFLCKFILNIELIPMQAMILQELWSRKFPMLIASRGAGKSWILSLYCILRALLMPGRKIVVVGAAFRQSKILHEYIEGMWKNAPVLRDICDTESGCFKDVDMCRTIINGSRIIALPIGDGSKIRGQRGHDIISDEHACLRSNSIIQTDEGLIEISDYLNSDAYSLLNMNGSLETPDKIFKTPKTDVYKVTTANGYTFSCSNIHQVMTTNGWKLAKDLTNEDNLVMDVNDYFPSRYVSSDGLTLDERMGWLFGLLISEGTVTNRNYIQISNTDKSLIDKVQEVFPDIKWELYEKEPYKDKRGFDCKRSWDLKYSNTQYRNSLFNMGITYSKSLQKTIPKGILRSPRSVVVSFLSGLFEGDGSAYNYVDKGKKRVGITYYSGSERLCEVLQILLLKFGITSSKTIRYRSQLSDKCNYMVNIRGEQAYKLFTLLKVLKWENKFDNADFLIKKPQITTVTKKTTRYNLSTNIGNKNKHIGSFASREEAVKAFEEYKKTEKPVFRVNTVELLPEQEHLYDFHMPETHSFIANGFIQHNSSSRDIFENVIAGFAAVSSNPVENVKRHAAKKKAKELGFDLEDVVEANHKANQIVISGTAYYDFNHFAEYWKKWRAIILSKGNKRKLEDIFMGEVPESFNWRDYSIIRIPVDLVPKGFMDEGQIARSKATIHTGIYQMEFGSVFSCDSQGFFKRSLIESCVGTDVKPIQTPSGPIYFDPMIKGNPTKKYIMGVDPASEVDNFSICIVELNSDHRKVVHCWTTNRKDQIQRVKLGLTTEDNFYSYCARRIRDLMGLFNVVHIAIDSQGGGIPVSEALHDSTQLKPGEIAIWPIIEDGKEKPSDDEAGLHIIELCHFANADWIGEANHGLRKDFEDKVLLLPRFDAISLGISSEQDAVHNRLFDTLEDCVIEIEELKNELSLIEISKTPTGRDRWDTPEVKTGAGKKKRLRKDRYSSLLMANMSARNFKGAEIQKQYVSYGGFASVSNINKDEPDYIGPNWFTSAMKDVY